MKFVQKLDVRTGNLVAPFAGAWIEILHRKCLKGLLAVAPFVGMWIEMQLAIWIRAATNVAPFAGAWIEISLG